MPSPLQAQAVDIDVYKRQPSLRGNGKGDLYVTVTVEIPKRLSEKQKNLLRQFDGTVTGQEYEQKKSFFDRVKEAFGGNS